MSVKKRRQKDILLVSIGYILSPLSWWNDLVVNVPLAYLFSLPFSLISEQLFIPCFVLGYWFTNLLGFLMLHWGGKGLIYSGRRTINVMSSLFVSVVYSLVIIIFVLLGWLEPPGKLLQQLK